MSDINSLPVGFDPIDYKPIHGGGQWLYRFDNGYGASVVCHQGSYGGRDGLFELGFIVYKDKRTKSWDFVTSWDDDSLIDGVDSSGVAGWLTLDDVARMLGEIRAINEH